MFVRLSTTQRRGAKLRPHLIQRGYRAHKASEYTDATTGGKERHKMTNTNIYAKSVMDRTGYCGLKNNAAGAREFPKRGHYLTIRSFYRRRGCHIIRRHETRGDAEEAAAESQFNAEAPTL